MLLRPAAPGRGPSEQCAAGRDRCRRRAASMGYSSAHGKSMVQRVRGETFYIIMRGGLGSRKGREVTPPPPPLLPWTSTTHPHSIASKIFSCNSESINRTFSARLVLDAMCAAGQAAPTEHAAGEKRDLLNLSYRKTCYLV